MDGSSLPEDDDNGDEQDGNKARQMAGRVQAIDANTAEQQLPGQKSATCASVPLFLVSRHSATHCIIKKFL